jgi:hypothetical protein
MTDWCFYFMMTSAAEWNQGNDTGTVTVLYLFMVNAYY